MGIETTLCAHVPLQARDPMLTKARFFSSVFSAVLMGIVFQGLSASQKGVQGANGCLFFLIMVRAWLPPLLSWLTTVTACALLTMWSLLCLGLPFRRHPDNQCG